MGIVSTAVAAILTVIGALLLGFVKDEASAWLPRLSRRIVTLAARRLPRDQSEDRREEWLADLEEWPGKLSQFLRAVGMFRASYKLFRRTALEREIAYQRMACAIQLGLFFLNTYALLFETEALVPGMLWSHVMLSVMCLCLSIVSYRCWRNFRYVKRRLVERGFADSVISDLDQFRWPMR